MKNRKKTLSLFLVLAMLLTMLGGLAVTASAEDTIPEEFKWWTPVSSADELKTAIANNKGAGNYYLTQDITVTTPLADDFQGGLAGNPDNPPTIKLQIKEENVATNTGVGLFRKLSSGKVKIKNIKLTGSIKVSGTDVKVGALAGISDSLYCTDNASETWNKAELSNIVNSANITVTGGQYVGGLIGYAFSSHNITATKLINYGNITVDKGNAAGIVGITHGGFRLSACENYGTIESTSKSAVGGIVSLSYSSSVVKCYNAGKIIGSSNSAGIIATNASGAATITGCISADGGILGITQGNSAKDPSFVECYYLDELNPNQSTTAGITSKTLADLKTMTTSDAFVAALETVDPVVGYETIRTPEQFQAIKADGKYYLANDIDLTELESGYTPLAEFKGELIGSANAKPTITMQITENASGAVNVGLFRTLGAGAKISNIRLDGSITVNAPKGNIGALAGALGGNYAAAVTNCVNAAKINVTGSTDSFNTRVGGFVGNLYTEWSGQIQFTNAVNEGSITVKNAAGSNTGLVGGICGISGWQYGLFSGCENYGALSGGNVGGITGQLYMQSNTDSKYTVNCYNAGALNGSAVGGIAGNLSGNRTFANCVNAGSINGIYPNAQSIYGVLNSASIAVTLEDTCLYLSNGDETGAKTLEEMKALTNAPAAFKTALDKLVLYTVTVAETENGTLTPSGSFYADSGSAFSVTAEPADGYRIASVTAGGNALEGNADNVYTATINGDVTITAEFEEIPALAPTIASPKGGAFDLTDGCGSITFGTVNSGNGYTIKDYGICYSKTSQEPTEKLSANAKALVNGQFGVKLLFAPALETGATYYTRPYVTFADADGQETTVYGDTVTTTIQ